jgi:hypothetical protein
MLYHELTAPVETTRATTACQDLYIEIEGLFGEDSPRPARRLSLTISWPENGEPPREINVNHLRRSQTEPKP